MSVNWANIVKTEKVDPEARIVAPVAPGARVVIVDANAIISGIRLETLGDKLLTTQEVFEEVRDQRSLHYLQALPVPLETVEPPEASVKAVLKFARATGDIHSLSRADIRLIALCHSAEVQTHGGAHLRAEPLKQRVHTKKQKKGKGLPGWDYVADEDGWAELDKIEGDTSQPQAASRIKVGGALDGSDDVAAPGAGPSSQAAAAAAPAFTFGRTEPAAAAPSTSTSAAAAEKPGASQAQAPAQAAPEADSEEEDDGWETAKKTRVRRRQQQKTARQAEAEDMARLERERALRELALMQIKAEGIEERSAGAAAAAGPSSSSAWGKKDAEEGEEEEEEGSGSDSEGEEGEGEPVGEDGDAELFEVVSVSSQEGEGAAGDGASALGSQFGGFESTVGIATADFAMQNVILQMGLRLISKDGMRIRELSRYALRCSACFGVTKEMERLFCPRCGNQALEKVTITVGPDGVEQFGVRRRHILRGTRYSLPLPKGGRLGSQMNPILREDVLMCKKGRRLIKKLRDAESTANAPFTPEFNDETWHKINHATSGKGIAFATASHKHNPNERRLTRSNRRK